MVYINSGLALYHSLNEFNAPLSPILCPLSPPRPRQGKKLQVNNEGVRHHGPPELEEIFNFPEKSLQHGSIGARPWYKQVSIFFWGVVNFVSAFFRTLINPGLNGKGDNYVTDYRGPGGPPKPPQRRVGRFATLSSCQAPMPGGG